VPADQWGWLPLAAGVSVVEAVGDFTDVEVVLKWPNDVLARGRKLAGILAEVAVPQRTIVVGIGLTVMSRPIEVEAPQAISLAELGPGAPGRQELVTNLLTELGERVGVWRDTQGTYPRLADEYRAMCATLGVLVRADLPGDREVVGIARDVDEQGRLCIDCGGETVVVSAGDIVHLRPAARPPR